MNKLKQIDFSSPAIQQRLLAVGILLLVVILFVLLIITPLVSKALELNETKSNLGNAMING